MELNEQQRQAIENNGHTLVIAGPGTGKTATLIAKAVKIIRENPDEKIVLLTFSKKAALEMDERILVKLIELKIKVENPFVGTIHSWCFQFLNEWRGRNIKLIDAKTQKMVINKILGELAISTKNVDKYLRTISLVKSGVSVLEDESLLAKFDYVQQEYQKRLGEEKQMDFDDLLLETASNLEAGEVENFMKKKLGKLFGKYLLVDEFQDLNYIQYNIVRHLQRVARGVLFAVGDPKQAIYGFRGADPHIFDKLITDFNTDIFKLQKTYRCADQICAAAGSIFSPPVKLQTYASKHGQVFHIFTDSDYTESYFVVQKIKTLAGSHEDLTRSDRITSPITSFGEIAVITRSYQTAKETAKLLHSSSIPFQVVGDLGWREFKQFGNLFDELCLIRDKKSDLLSLGLNATILNGAPLSLAQLLEKILGQTTLPDAAGPWKSRWLTMAHQYGSNPWDDSLPLFLAECELLTQEDESEEGERVRIMSIHAAKGLEFEVVFVLGCDEGLLPYSKSIEAGEEGINEENRLMFVAMTRAKSRLFLLSAQGRQINGKRVTTTPSRFLNNLESKWKFKDELALDWQVKKVKRKEKLRQVKLF